MTFECHVRNKYGERKRARCLADNGATGLVVNQAYVKEHQLQTVKAANPARLKLAQGNVVDKMDRLALVRFWIGEHATTDWFWVTPLKDYDIILGMPWLEQHDPHTSWSERTMTFNSHYCSRNCLERGLPVTVTSLRDGRSKVETSRPPLLPQNVGIISGEAAFRMGQRDETCLAWVTEQELQRAELEEMVDPTTTFTSVFASDTTSVTNNDFDKFHKKLNSTPPTLAELRDMVPEAFHDIIDLWDPRQAAGELLSGPEVDHEIRLRDGSTPPHKKAYGLSRQEALVVKAYLDDELKKGHIRSSKSPYAAPLLVVKKPGGGLRICIDYRQLNALTIKNRNSPPQIRDTLARMNKARVFSKFDVIAAFNRLRVRPEDQEKTAFITRYGLYEYICMPFGLCNAPGTFQEYINRVLAEYLDEFCSAYLDDVLVYSEDESLHEDHCRKVLTRLRKAGLFLDIGKCQFSVKKVTYLGMILSTEGLEMDPAKIRAIQDWADPEKLKDVQAFIGFANFYRRFIFGFSRIVAPMTLLIKEANQGKKFSFSEEARTAFNTLKKAFISAPVLAHFDPELESTIETDASDYVVSAILSQKHGDVLRPVAYFSMKMTGPETNYPIYDKELLAIIKAFEEWRPELAGTDDPIEVFSDHKALEYFMTTKKLNRRQARWAEFLSEFHFVIHYRPGKQGTKPDSLTRRPGDIPQGVEDDRLQHNYQTILTPDRVKAKSTRDAIYLAHIIIEDVTMTVPELAHELYLLSEEMGASEEYLDESLMPLSLDDNEGDPGESWNNQGDTLSLPPAGEESQDELLPQDTTLHLQHATENDEVIQEIFTAMDQGHRRPPHHLIKQGIRLEIGDCKKVDGLLHVRDKIFVPFDDELRTKLIRSFHDTKPAGHHGRNATFTALSQYYYWPGITDAVARYTRNCLTCARSKHSREGKHGLLNPLPVPDTYWTGISIDFITPLPESHWRGHTYRHIMVTVDRLSKKKKFVPLENLDVETMVQAFIEYIWREEGYPTSIVSDRGTQFTSHFWKRLCDRIGTHPKLSTTSHPETDGQTEIANQALKQYLRAFVHYDQENWAEYLPFAEFQANTDKSATTGLSPFWATKGYNPRSGLEPESLLPSSLGWKAKRDASAADNLLNRIENLRSILKQNLSWARAKMEQYANQYRLPAPTFKKGDWVMLDAKNIKTKRSSTGLSEKKLGPYQVMRNIDNKAYQLDLGRDLQGLFPVFHPWLLHPHEIDPLPGQHQPPQPPVDYDEDGTPIYTVEEILDSKLDKRMKNPCTDKRGLLQYLVKWEGYDKPDWQPYFNVMEGSKEALKEFHERQPNKPGPYEAPEVI